jgi:hypothetical protein
VFQAATDTERQIVDWVTMITINDAYYWQPDDNEVAEWINFLGLDFTPEG